ncbi:hypothetical protein SLS56_003511 [Neofusicoccum ribis]|uniref:SET domain-containing protein n=1 Tax=Neofusicoccum ribis TaxID=45134 RepID=A0ABR3SZQ7_9PEZI
MSSPGDEAHEISAHIIRSIQKQLASLLHEQLLASDGLVKHTLKIEGVIHEGWDGADKHQVPRRINLASVDIAAIRAASSAPRTPATTNDSPDPSGDLPNGALALSRPQRARRPPPRDYLSDPEPASKRRKETGGLRLGRPSNPPTASASDETEPATGRQIEPETRKFPQRKKVAPKVRPMQPSTLDRLIIGIWEQIHGSISFDPQIVIDQWKEPRTAPKSIDSTSSASQMELTPAGSKISAFNKMNVLCRKVTTASRCCRSLEVIVQAYWIQCFEARVQTLSEFNPQQSVTKSRKAALMEACQDFGWSEKDLRNKMAIWRGYYEIKEAAGWVALVFAGMGIYRFCKYRISFDKEAMQRLASLRPRLEVAADTLQPQWRQLLSFIGEPSERQPFERGMAVGEFVGLVTRGLRDMDVMQGETNGNIYQIWQGRQGNYTRFVNHSCHPNSQFEKFTWLGVQRIILVSKGIEAGQEITVDYSGRYWTNLDKECLCGESCCRYRNRGRRVEIRSPE